MSDLKAILQGLIPDEKLNELVLLEARLNSHTRLVSNLGQDYDVVLNDLNVDSSDQLKRRTLVRTLFAMIEGVLYVFKQFVLVQHEHGSLELSPAEYALLTEESYDLRENGRIRTSSKFIKLTTNLKFSFSIFAEKLVGQQFEIDTNTQDWANVVRAVEVRNRLMHPKSEADLQVSDLELDYIKTTAHWFNNHFQQLISASVQVAKQSTLKRIRESVEKNASANQSPS